MNEKTKNILSLCIAVFPINIAMVWYRLTQNVAFSPLDLILFPLLFGGLSILLILCLNKFFLKQKMSIFNDGISNVKKDLLASFILTIIYFALFFLERITLFPLLSQNTPVSSEIITAIQAFSQNPLLLILWFGPVLWIGIALFEELSRVFMLKCLWNLSENKKWMVLVILITSVMIGVVHLYQGVYGIITIALKSIIMCGYFYKFRRIGPLIISHALYDGIQFILLLIEISSI